MTEWVTSILPSIIVGIFMYYFERRQNKRDKALEKKQEKRDSEVEKLSQARKKETLLGLKMQMSAAKLAYATAVAVKRGYANGEVEDGIEDYEISKGEYFDFINEQATERLNT